MTEQQMIDGTPVRLGAREIVVPALTIKQLKQYRPLLDRIGAFTPESAPTDADIDAALEMVHACVKRNHPEITMDDLLDGIDARNLPKVFKAIIGQA